MAKVMFLVVKRQWRRHERDLTSLFAVCGHKQNYLKDQVGYSTACVLYASRLLHTASAHRAQESLCKNQACSSQAAVWLYAEACAL